MKNTELEQIIEKYDLIGKSAIEIRNILTNNKLVKKINNVCYFDCIVRQSTEILEYINQHYAIKPDVMRELKKDENVRRILEGTSKTLQADKWNLVVHDERISWAIFGNTKDKDGNYNGFHFDLEYGTFHEFGQSIINDCEIKSVRLMTPEEIQSMLVKKLEAEGLKVWCMVDRSDMTNNRLTNIVDIREIERGSGYIYHESSDELLFNGCVVYSKGKFAKIIQPELTIEQRLERLEKHLKID